MVYYSAERSRKTVYRHYGKSETIDESAVKSLLMFLHHRLLSHLKLL